MWTEFGSALALVLIIEGVMPFLSPGRFRHTMAQVAQLPDRHLRGIGLGSMLVGVTVLYLVR